MPKPKKTSYARLNLKFKSIKAAYRAYRYLSLAVELDILPKIEFQLNDTLLVIGWYGTAEEIEL